MCYNNLRIGYKCIFQNRLVFKQQIIIPKYKSLLMTYIDENQFSQKYKVVSKIAYGTSSEVFKIQDVSTRQLFALKVIQVHNLQQLMYAFQQIEVVRTLNHPTSIQVFYYFIRNGDFFLIQPKPLEFGIVMELADRNLEQDLLQRKKNKNFYSQDQIKGIFSCLIDFFSYCQEKNYLHRDIKPANLVYKREACNSTLDGKSLKKRVYKVCDFGFAMQNHAFAHKNIAGTEAYASPKLQRRFVDPGILIQGNNVKDDVYSLGITMLEISSLELIEKSPKALLQKVNLRYGIKFGSIIKRMVQPVQEKRADFFQLKDKIKYIKEKNNDGVKKGNQYLNQKGKANGGSTEGLLEDDRQFSMTQKKFIEKKDYRSIIDSPSGDDSSVKQVAHPKLQEIGTKKEKENKIEQKQVGEIKQETTGTRRKRKNLGYTINIDEINEGDRENLTKKGVQKYEQNKSTPENDRIEHLKHVRQENENSKLIFKFENSRIDLIQVLQLQIASMNNGKYCKSSLIAAIVQNTLYLCLYFYKSSQAVQVKFSNELPQIVCLKMNKKNEKLYIICKENSCISLSIPLIQNQLITQKMFVNASNLQVTYQKLTTQDQTAFEIDEKTGNIFQSYKNGDISQNGKSILQASLNGTIQFVKKCQTNIYTAMSNGLIGRFKTFIEKKDHSTLCGLYNCKSTLVAFELKRIGSGDNLIVIAVTYSGFVLYLSDKLELLQIKKISKSCLRGCCINLKQNQQSRKIVVINTCGEIIDQTGCIIKKTGILNANGIFFLRQANKVIIPTQNGEILQVDLNQSKGNKNKGNARLTQPIRQI